MYRSAYVDLCPPSLAGGPCRTVRRVPTSSGDAGARQRRRRRRGPRGLTSPNVYVTLGTMLDEADLLRLLLDASRRLN